MALHDHTFAYLKPTEAQGEAMGKVCSATASYALILDENLPDGPDKTYVLRKLREVAMWANIAITRQPDGSPRT